MKFALLSGTVSQSALTKQRKSQKAEVTHFLNDNEDDDEIDVENEDIQRRAQHDYQICYRAELDIRKRKLSLRYLHSAFRNLPKLRHFEYSDFRALSRKGETARELCNRLFGETLSPDLLPDDQ